MYAFLVSTVIDMPNSLIEKLQYRHKVPLSLEI